MSAATPADCCAAHQDVDPAELAAIHPDLVRAAREIPVCVVELERQLAKGRAMAAALPGQGPLDGLDIPR